MIPNCGPGPDGTIAGATGPHYGMEGAHHNMPSQEKMPMKPTGDLPPLRANLDGSVKVTFDADWLTLDEIRGQCLVIHAGKSTKTAGAPKYACGIIG